VLLEDHVRAQIQNVVQPNSPMKVHLLQLPESTVNPKVPSTYPCFLPGLGTYSGPRITLKLNPEVVPKYLPARTLPYARVTPVDQELERLIGFGSTAANQEPNVGNTNSPSDFKPITKETGRESENLR